MLFKSPFPGILWVATKKSQADYLSRFDVYWIHIIKMLTWEEKLKLSKQICSLNYKCSMTLHAQLIRIKETVNEILTDPASKQRYLLCVTQIKRTLWIDMQLFSSVVNNVYSLFKHMCSDCINYYVIVVFKKNTKIPIKWVNISLKRIQKYRLNM